MSEMKDVRVKALEWVELGFAHTSTGVSYRILREPGYWKLEKHEGPSTTNSAHANEDAAKAAAQADYERRILAALEPAPKPAVRSGCDHDWEKTHEDLCMFVCSKCRQAFNGNVIGNKPEGWTGKYQSRATPPPPSTGAVDVGELLAAIKKLPNVTISDPEDAYGVSDKAYVELAKVLAILKGSITDGQ